MKRAIAPASIGPGTLVYCKCVKEVASVFDRVADEIASCENSPIGGGAVAKLTRQSEGNQGEGAKGGFSQGLGCHHSADCRRYSILVLLSSNINFSSLSLLVCWCLRRTGDMRVFQ